MKFVSLLLTFLIVAPCVKVASDDIYNNQENSLLGAPITDESEVELID
jgi:hypothetical protein